MKAPNEVVGPFAAGTPYVRTKPFIRSDQELFEALTNIQHAESSKNMFETNIRKAKRLEKFQPDVGVLLHSCTSEEILTENKVGNVVRGFLNETRAYVLVDDAAAKYLLGIPTGAYPAQIRDGKLSYIAEGGRKWIVCDLASLLKRMDHRGLLDV